jgi:hypothetical protein
MPDEDLKPDLLPEEARLLADVEPAAARRWANGSRVKDYVRAPKMFRDDRHLNGETLLTNKEV